MGKYRKTLKTRTILLSLLTAAAVAVVLYSRFIADTAIRESDIFGFQCGLLTGLGLIGAVLIFRYRALLGNEEKLKLEYHKENDERYKAIRAKAGMPMLLVTSVGMIVAGVVAGYYSRTVFITLIGAAMCQMLIGAAVKGFFLKKM